MEPSMSAFAIYKANKNRNNSKRQKIKNKKKDKQKTLPNANTNLNQVTSITDSDLPADTGYDLIRVAQKVKQVIKETKQPKNIGSKKSRKSKKSNGNMYKKNKLINAKIDSVQKLSESDDAPQLLSGPLVLSANNRDGSSVSGNDCCQDSNTSFEFIPVETESREEGFKVFKWLIAPHDPNVFLNQIWEKKPLHIARKKQNYYKELITTLVIDDMLRKENIQFTKNIDITSYVNEERKTHNPEGRAYPHIVWDFYLNGCSIRLLNPQTYIPKLHLLNATLQEFFNSFVGANAYLTPPDSQGFAPHYDDIEAFILQTEGKKLWKIYKPRSGSEVLPRVSSKNFSQEEIGEPIMEIMLEAGDLLYFPRGYIHQGITIEGEHSLHVTVSMYQKHSWADLFEKMIPAALHLAISDNVDLRRGLPFDIYDNFGLVNSDVNTPRRKKIEELIKSLFDKIKDHLPIDEAVDQMNKNYQQDALPPVLSDLEKAVTVYGDSDMMIENGKVINRVELSLDTRIRLLRKNILRMVQEDEHIRLYYHVENSLEYHGNELPFLEIDEELAPAIETLITTYPEYIAIENLDIQNDSDKLQAADALWSRGLIMTEYPMENIDDD